MKSKGYLITIEGNEGCGKSTQIRLLQAYLRKRGFRVIRTREPGGTRIGDAVRRVLLERKNARMTPLCETFLYMAARAQLVDETIRPRLRQGCIVLCDRWLDATVAYQGYAGGIDVSWIRSLGRKATGGLKPFRSFYLDLPVEVGLRRASARKKADRVERKGLSFHRSVRRGFLRIARREPGRFKVVRIRPADSVSAVHEKIKKALGHAF